MKFKGIRKKPDTFVRPPQEPQRRRIPIGKYLYIAVLLLFSLLFIRWFIGRMAYIKGIGILDASSISVEPSITARIKEIKCQLNDRVSAGEVLVVLDPTEIEYQIAKKKRELDERSSLFRQRIANVEQEIDLLKKQRENQKAEILSLFASRIAELDNEIKLAQLEKDNQQQAVDDLQLRYQRAQDLFALETITRTRLLEVYFSLQDAQRELSLLEKKLSIYKDQRNELQKEYERVQRILKTEVPPRIGIRLSDEKLKLAEGELYLISARLQLATSELARIKTEFESYTKNMKNEIEELQSQFKNTVLLAPINGIVYRIYKKPDEIARVADAVLKVADPTDTYIRTYFDVRYEVKIQPGLKVKVVFENGSRYSGRIRRVYPATEALAPEYRRYFGHREVFIIAEVIPTDSGWEGILGTRATVYVPR